MGVYIDTDNLQNCPKKLEECTWGLDDCKNDVNKCEFPSDEGREATFVAKKAAIIALIQSVSNLIKKDIKDVNAVITDFENAENKNNQIANNIISGGIAGANIVANAIASSSNNSSVPTQDANTNLEGNSVSSTSSDSDIPTQDADIKLEDDEGIQTETPNQTENIDNEEVDIDLEGNVPGTQVETVIELIYGENPTLTDDEKERIAEAILQINETEILEGLDEDIANSIRADIVEDYLNGELDLEGITADELQQYIESQPSINIKFELDEAINNFESLVESGELTEEQINSVIEENIQICTEEEFATAYEEFNNTQTDVSNVESFYDTENNKVYIRDTSDSTLITKVIISVLGTNILFDDETGQISYVNDIEDVKLSDFSNISMNGEENTVSNDNVDLEDGTNISE